MIIERWCLKYTSVDVAIFAVFVHLAIFLASSLGIVGAFVDVRIRQLRARYILCQLACMLLSIFFQFGKSVVVTVNTLDGPIE